MGDSKSKNDLKPPPPRWRKEKESLEKNWNFSHDLAINISRFQIKNKTHTI